MANKDIGYLEDNLSPFGRLSLNEVQFENSLILVPEIVKCDMNRYPVRHDPPRYDCEFDMLMSLVEGVMHGESVVPQLETLIKTKPKMTFVEDEFRMESTGKVVSVIENEIFSQTEKMTVINPSKGTLYRMSAKYKGYQVVATRRYSESEYYRKNIKETARSLGYPVIVSEIRELQANTLYYLGTRGWRGNEKRYRRLDTLGLEYNPMYGAAFTDTLVDVVPAVDEDGNNCRKVKYMNKDYEDYMNYYDFPFMLRYHASDYIKSNLTRRAHVNMFNVVASNYHAVGGSVKTSNKYGFYYTPDRLAVQEVVSRSEEKWIIRGTDVTVVVMRDKFGNAVDIESPPFCLSTRLKLLSDFGGYKHFKPISGKYTVLNHVAPVISALKFKQRKNKNFFSVSTFYGTFDGKFVPDGYFRQIVRVKNKSVNRLCRKVRKEFKSNSPKKKKGGHVKKYFSTVENYASNVFFLADGSVNESDKDNFYFYLPYGGQVKFGDFSMVEGAKPCVIVFRRSDKGNVVMVPTQCNGNTYDLYPRNRDTILLPAMLQDVADNVNEGVHPLTLEDCRQVRFNFHDYLLHEAIIYPEDPEKKFEIFDEIEW